MSRAGDHDEGEQGGSIAQIGDASRRRTDGPIPRVRKRPRAKPTPPYPDVGTGLLSNLYGEEPDRLFEESADDLLDRIIDNDPERSGAELDSLASDAEARLNGSFVSPTAALGGEYDDVREQIEHHHERRQPSRQGVPVRGSADLDPRRSQAGGSRLSRQARRSGRRSPRVARSALAVAGVAVLVAAALVVGANTDSGSGSTHRGAGQAASLRMSAVNDPDTVAEDITRAITAVGADMEAQAKVSIAGEAKAQRRARTLAKVAERARAAGARQRRAAVARARSEAPAASSAVTTTHASSTTAASTPSADSATGATSSSVPTQHSPTAPQPAFGSNGSLGPGRSSDS